jgi:hypothetical protein
MRAADLPRFGAISRRAAEAERPCEFDIDPATDINKVVLHVKLDRKNLCTSR